MSNCTFLFPYKAKSIVFSINSSKWSIKGVCAIPVHTKTEGGNDPCLKLDTRTNTAS